jgi:hypothetical protein
MASNDSLGFGKKYTVGVPSSTLTPLAIIFS